MAYRWFNVKVEVDEDGGASVLFEGRGEFPFAERVEIEAGDNLVVHGHIDMNEQPEEVDWYMKNVNKNEVVAQGVEE